MANSEMKPLILASSSPRRVQIITELGVPFIKMPADIDETPFKNEKPLEYVKRIAYEKALKIHQTNPNEVILAADTTVCVGRRILGKPEDAADAKRMLNLMSGRSHKVITSVCVVDKQGKFKTKTVSSIIKVGTITIKDIEHYIANENNWRGVAGAYKIQDVAGMRLARSINGSVSAVVGLPVAETVGMLKACGYDL